MCGRLHALAWVAGASEYGQDCHACLLLWLPALSLIDTHKHTILSFYLMLASHYFERSGACRDVHRKACTESVVTFFCSF